MNDELSCKTARRLGLDVLLRRRGAVGGLRAGGAITKDMQTYCVNDYKKFCGDYGLQSAALNLCMRKAGPGLSPACVQALVKAGKVSQADVDKIKAKAKGL